MKKILFFTLGIIGIVGFLFAADIQFGEEVNHEARAAAGDTLQVDTFVVSSTWFAPAGVTEVYVEAWGGGGGGSTAVGGGGGGAYAASTVTVTPGSAYWISVSSSTASNINGATSTFATTTVVAAPGWSAGNRSLGGAVASSTGDVVFAGGGGVRGAASVDGGGAAGDLAAGVAGLGGARNGGRGISGGTTNASFFGIGGGSGAAAQAIGSGGQVRISYTSSVNPLYPTVAGRSYSSEVANTKSHIVQAPTGTQIGDLLLIVFGADGASNTSTISAGWTTLQQTSGTGSGTISESIFYKVADGSDTATITTANSEAASSIVFRIQNGGTPVATSSRGSSVNANPPSLNTGVSAKYLWIATGVWDANAVMRVTAPPSTFKSFITQPSRISNEGVGVAVSEIFAEQQTTNPGTWGSTNEQWIASTIAIPYQAPTPSGDTVFGPRRQRMLLIQ